MVFFFWLQLQLHSQHNIPIMPVILSLPCEKRISNLSRDPSLLRAPLPGRIRDCAPCRRKGFTCTTWDHQLHHMRPSTASSLHCLGVSHQHFHDPAVLLIMSTQHVLAKDSGSDMDRMSCNPGSRGNHCSSHSGTIETMLQAGAFDSWKLWVNQIWEFQQ